MKPRIDNDKLLRALLRRFIHEHPVRNMAHVGRLERSDVDDAPNLEFEIMNEPGTGDYLVRFTKEPAEVNVAPRTLRHEVKVLEKALEIAVSKIPMTFEMRNGCFQHIANDDLAQAIKEMAEIQLLK